MATGFALNFLGARFRVKLVDCVTEANVDVSDVVSQNIIFYLPDGTTLTKTATLVEDPALSGNFFIQYTNGNSGSPPETVSILDQNGDWEYAGQVTLTNGDTFDSFERFVFWVK